MQLDTVESLQWIKRQQNFGRVFYADKDVAEVAACLQRLMQPIFDFLVDDCWSMLKVELCLSTATGGKCTVRDQNQSSGASERMAMFAECVLRRSERKCTEALTTWRMFSMRRQKPHVRPCTPSLNVAHGSHT